jgi:hypothetical protein
VTLCRSAFREREVFVADRLTNLLGIEHPVLSAPMGFAGADGCRPPSPTRAGSG